MDAKDRAYFLRRALQEQQAARNAACPEARERHEELAAAYRFKCSESVAFVRLVPREPAEPTRHLVREKERVL